MTNKFPELAAGLLRILRQAAWLRGGLIIISILLYLSFFPGKSALLLLLGFAVERALFIVFVTWDPLRRKLGATFLPIALGWLFVTPLVEIALSILSSDDLLRAIGAQADVLGVSSPLIWLVVPVVLAVWQYGRRGLQIAMVALIVEHLALGTVLWSDVSFGVSFLFNSGGRIAMLGLLGYVVMLLVDAQKKDHNALEQANRQLAQHAATAEQLTVSRERNRMARELHDVLAHSITALSLQVQAAGKLVDSDPLEAKTLLREAQALTRTSANEVRRSLQALRATQLQDLGLAASLREMCRMQAERTGAELDCAIGDIPALDPLTEQAVYRIAQETLANVERHSAATRVSVRLEVDKAEHLRLTIQDNGVGFDARAIPPGHYGLIGLSERAREAGGKLSVHSKLGEGTRMELELGL